MNLPLITIPLEEYEKIKDIKKYIDNMHIEYESYYICSSQYDRIAYINEKELIGLIEIMGILKPTKIKLINDSKNDKKY